jgi:hypothetical protein
MLTYYVYGGECLDKTRSYINGLYSESHLATKSGDLSVSVKQSLRRSIMEADQLLIIEL